MEMKNKNYNEIRLDDIPNAFNKHFVELGHNLSQKLQSPKDTPQHCIARVHEHFKFQEN